MVATGSDQTRSVGERIHNILARQLRAVGSEPGQLADQPSWFWDLLEAVSSYYDELETTRNRLEGSLRRAISEIKHLENTITDLESEAGRDSEGHYHNLFERTPIPTWEEDFSAVAEWIESLRAQGVDDFPAYLDDHPDEFVDAVGMIQVTNVNQAAARMVRASDEATLLGPIKPSLVNEDSAPSFKDEFLGIWEGKESVKTQVVGSRLTGEQFDGLLEWQVPRVGRHLDYTRVLVTIVDISEQKAAERTALEILKSKDEMLASVSHELRTPLTSVLGFAEMLRVMDSGDYEEERDEILRIIAGQAGDLADLVEDLLAAARSELGQLTLAAVPVNLHAQIAQVEESRTLALKKLTVPKRPGEPVLAKADPQRVRQILRNLVTNAERYGGPEIAFEVEEADDSVTVRVLDNGEGLPPDARERVFERYYRSSAGELHPGSVGLGLTIARELARKMDGDLVYRRREGWSSFELTLPRLEGQAAD